jgi:hypothetical protein
MYTVFSNAVLLMQVFAAGTGLALYANSFSGYGWNNEEIRFVVAAFICSILASIPTTIRDGRFFRKHWGLGALGVRNRFPLELFPARRDKWLNTLGWCFLAILFLHFFWVVINSPDHEAAPLDASAALRYVSLMVIYIGVMGGLGWEYPPTEKPQAKDP